MLQKFQILQFHKFMRLIFPQILTLQYLDHYDETSDTIISEEASLFNVSVQQILSTLQQTLLARQQNQFNLN